jgi:hypothetical protein
MVFRGAWAAYNAHLEKNPLVVKALTSLTGFTLGYGTHVHPWSSTPLSDEPRTWCIHYSGMWNASAPTLEVSRASICNRSVE